MVKTVIIIYIVCFSVYVLFSRQPDFFDGQITTGSIHFIKDSNNQQIPFAVFSADQKQFSVNVNYPLRNFTEREKVQLIFEDAQPQNAALYSVWGYWIKWQEVLASVVLIFVLFQIAVALTSNPTPEALLQELEGRKRVKKRKYNN